MKTPSLYLQRKFRRHFSRGCEFWTSEDGCLNSLVIAKREDWDTVLAFEFSHRLTKPIDASMGRHCYAEQEWVGLEFFDGGSGRRAGKVWRLTDTPTPFPVIEYPLV